VVGFQLTGLGIDVLRAAVDPAAPNAKWPLGWNPPSDWSLTAELSIVGGLMALMAVVSLGVKYWAAIVSSKLSQRIVIQLRTDVYDKLQRLSFRYFDDHDSSSLINRVAGDVQAVRQFVDGVVIKFLVVIITLVVCIGYMLRLHVGLTLACLATTPLLWWGAVWFARVSRDQYLKASQLGDEMVRVLSENVQGIQVVKGFAAEPRQIALFAEANQRIVDHKFKIFWNLSLYQPIMGVLTQINMLVLIGYGSYLTIRGDLPLGTGLFVFANLLHEFANQVGHVTNIANSIQSSLTASERVFEVLDAPLEVESPDRAKRPAVVRGEYVLEGVNFGYLAEKPVLKDISLKIPAGQMIGITGETGTGKTTLLSLLARFHDPTSGRILLDGIDLREWDLADLRRQIGMVFQESFLFSNTVANNIAFGKPGATAAEIEQAALLAAAEEFVAEMPGRYQNVVGEYGTNLSGGQKQRLALARAILLWPPILILDDATAAVDSETEHAIQTTLASFHGERTIILVSSRVSTLRHADNIFVLNGGTVAEAGNHHDLMQLRGHYFQMAQLQAWEQTLSTGSEDDGDNPDDDPSSAPSPSTASPAATTTSSARTVGGNR
jgi:ATP-binding cassette subfamily B protein